VRGGYLLVMTSVGSLREGERISGELVRARHAACVSVLPGAISRYVWKGKLERSRECVLLVKTTRAAFPSLKTALLRTHPFDVPEVVALGIVAGSAPYLRWVSEMTRRAPRTPSRGPRRGRPRPRSRR
jgi:periplasmic divalent cation tolerance protein